MKKRFLLLLAGIAGFCTVNAQDNLGFYLGGNISTFKNVNDKDPSVADYPEIASNLQTQFGVTYTLDLKHHLNLEFEMGIQKVSADVDGIIQFNDTDIEARHMIADIDYTSLTFSPLLQYWVNDTYSFIAGPKISTYLDGHMDFDIYETKLRPLEDFNVSLALGVAAELNNRLSFHIRDNIGTWEMTTKPEHSYYELRHQIEFGIGYKLNM